VTQTYRARISIAVFLHLVCSILLILQESNQTLEWLQTVYVTEFYLFQICETEGGTMLLIAFQTGLTDLKPMQRSFLMSILLFIVVSSLIESMYEVSDPILLSLSASV
jgi:hypothetical protein